MEIPKYIDKLLERRARAAETFMNADRKISGWLNKNNIVVSEDDVLTGACSLCEPWSSIDHIRATIQGKE